MNAEEHARRMKIAMRRLLDVSLELIDEFGDELADPDVRVTATVTSDRITRYAAWFCEAEFLLGEGHV